MAVGPELERCGNEIDDDCDGTADEGCPCPLLTVACASGCCDVPDVPVATGVTPSIATDADGRVFVAYVSSSRETRLATFDPATATWSDQLMGSWSARPVVRVGPDGRVHVLFVESSSYLGIVTAYPEYRVSSDHGRTWTADDPYGPEGEGLNGDLALDATGRAHVVLSDTRRTVYFVRDGSRWTAGAPEAGGRTSLRLAVDTFSRPRVIYLEPMGGSPVLRHAYFDGAAWRYETIDATGPFGSVSDAHGRHDLAIGADGNSEVLYVRGTRAGGHSLIYAVRSAAGAWTSTETPATGGDIANARLARASSGAPLAIADGLALLESRPGPWARTAIPVTGFHAAVARRRSDLLVAFNTTYAGGSLRLTRLRR